MSARQPTACSMNPSHSWRSRVLIRESPVVGFESHELEGVAERVDREEARPAWDLPVVVEGRDAARVEVAPERIDIVDPEARVAARLVVGGRSARLGGQVQLLPTDGKPHPPALEHGRGEGFLGT